MNVHDEENLLGHIKKNHVDALTSVPEKVESDDNKKVEKVGNDATSENFS